MKVFLIMVGSIFVSLLFIVGGLLTIISTACFGESPIANWVWGLGILVALAIVAYALFDRTPANIAPSSPPEPDLDLELHKMQLPTLKQPNKQQDQE